MTTPINELDLQRCIDGELPAIERRELLKRIETTPDGWKTLALAFLENQDFDSAGVEFRQGASALPAALAGKNSTIPRRSSAWAVPSLALAASLAAAFWVGKQGGRPALNMPLDEEGLVASQTYAPENAGSGQRGVMKPAAVLELPFGGAESERLSLPVYDQQMLANEEPEIPLWPDHSRQRAGLRPGYRLTSERNVIEIPLESGDRVLVPVEVSGVRYAVQ